MEIGRAGIRAIDRQVRRDFLEQERAGVGAQAFRRHVVESLGPEDCLVCRIPVAVDRHDVLPIEAKRFPVRP